MNDELELSFTGSQNEKKSANKIEVQSEFDQAFGNLTDPLLPVRGFAMIRIAALLHAKDPKALQNTDSLLKIFQQQLTHDDSYIYLAAIKGLVALASTRTEEVISHLTREFSCLRVKSSQGQREAELKIKEKGLYKTAVEKGNAILTHTPLLHAHTHRHTHTHSPPPGVLPCISCSGKCGNQGYDFRVFPNSSLKLSRSLK